MIERRIKFFLFLMTLHGSLLITSTVAGSKLFALPFGLSASATVISYMLTFVVLDAIAELYGAKFSRLVINLGLIGMALSALYFKLTIALPPAGVWPYQQAFETVLGSSWRIWLAGWLAYLASQYLDLWGFLKMRDLTQGRAPLADRVRNRCVLRSVPARPGSGRPISCKSGDCFPRRPAGLACGLSRKALGRSG
jgi:uncharacterized integral membrane protein (TIGR00697 family)